MIGRPDKIPLRPDYSATRGQRIYDPRLRASIPLFKSHVLGKSFNPVELGKNDEAVDLVIRAATTPMGIGSDGAALAATKIIDTAIPITGPSAARELISRGLRVEFGRAADFPILSSVALASGTIVAVEAGSFVSGVDPIPEYQVSNATSLHMEADSPLQLVSGTGPTVASPIRSLLQTACTAVKLVLTCSWAMRATGHVQVVNSVNW